RAGALTLTLSPLRGARGHDERAGALTLTLSLLRGERGPEVDRIEGGRWTPATVCPRPAEREEGKGAGSGFTPRRSPSAPSGRKAGSAEAGEGGFEVDVGGLDLEAALEHVARLRDLVGEDVHASEHQVDLGLRDARALLVEVL